MTIDTAKLDPIWHPVRVITIQKWPSLPLTDSVYMTRIGNAWTTRMEIDNEHATAWGYLNSRSGAVQDVVESYPITSVRREWDTSNIEQYLMILSEDGSISPLKRHDRTPLSGEIAWAYQVDYLRWLQRWTFKDVESKPLYFTDKGCAGYRE